jgi:hypothetical protein
MKRPLIVHSYAQRDVLGQPGVNEIGGSRALEIAIGSGD